MCRLNCRQDNFEFVLVDCIRIVSSHHPCGATIMDARSLPTAISQSMPRTQSVGSRPHAGDRDEYQRLRQIRERIVDVLNAAGGGHYGGSLSVADILFVLYNKILRRNQQDPHWPDRDRLILSKGHAAVALYSVLVSIDVLSAVKLEGYGTQSGVLAGHPDMTCTDGVEFSTGSLGQGLAAGVGMALALRDRGCHVWAVLGDGECQEGQVWEAAMLASRYQISNLHAVVDLNGYQELGWHGQDVARPEPLPDAAAKWAAFGWKVFEVAGHNLGELEAAMREAVDTAGRPSVLIAHTIKGHGIAAFEQEPGTSHCVNLPSDRARELIILGDSL